MHIDVNNAFLSWSAVDLLNKGYKYDIRDSYAVIGGDEKKRSGIVLAKSNSAKKLGIITAETLYSARKKCKVLKVYPPNYKFYNQMSQKLFSLIKKYSPDIEIASIDECYLDYTSVKSLYGNPINFAYKLKDEIKNTLGFTVNIGIANNKLCAKMASDFSKPDKVHTLYKNEIESKMFPLDIGSLFGIGKRTVPKLQKLGIYKISDLAHTDPLKLEKYFKNQAINMINWANGIDDSIVDSSEYHPACIGNEFTLVTNLENKAEAHHQLLLLSEYVSKRLRQEGKYASVVCVVIKDEFLKRKSHQRKLVNETDITDEIYMSAISIFDEFWTGEPIRLIGLRLDGLTYKRKYQASIFDDIEKRDKDEKIDKVIDNINSKFGNNVIKKASLEDFKTKKDM